MAVVLSGSPNYLEAEILNVVEIESGTGKNQAEAVWAVLEQCGATDSVRAFLFYTTASNTGCWLVLRVDFF